MVELADMNQADRVARAIDAISANSDHETKTQTEQAFNQAFAKRFADIGLIVTAIMGAVFFTLLLLTGNTMAQAVRERIPELAVLKTIGFSNRSVLWLVLAESMLLVALGGLIGLALAAALMPMVSAMSGGMIQLPTVLPQTWLLGLGLMLLIGAVVGALPALRAMRLNIVDALAGRWGTHMKNFLVNFGIVLVLAIALGVWIVLPWYLVLAIAVLLALWLLLTRGGRLALAAAKVGIAGLPQRWGASSVIVVGIAGVVGVLVAMLAMGAGFAQTLKQTGSADTAIILRGGSQAETNSVITRDQVPLISALDGIARGGDGKAAGVARALAGGEPAEQKRRHRCERADPRRRRGRLGAAPAGEDRAGPQVRARPARAGRRPGRDAPVPRHRGRQERDVREPAVDRGRRIRLRRFARFRTLGRRRHAGLDLQPPGVPVRHREARRRDGFRKLKAALAGDPRLKLDVLTTHDYYAKQSEGLEKLIGSWAR